MRNWEIYAILCYAEFRNSGIPTDRNLMEINCTSENLELRGNLTEITKRTGNFGQNPVKFRHIPSNSVIFRQIPSNSVKFRQILVKRYKDIKV